MKISLYQNDKPQLTTFVKTPHPHIVEVLAHTKLDFLILDTEHAPFDRTTLDLCTMAARGAQVPTIIRLESGTPSAILNALDCGASGLLIPHVTTAEQARTLVKKSHFGHGGRGYAGSTRAAGYGSKSIEEHIRTSRHSLTLIVQIEDPEGVDHAEEIAAIDGIDALFIGQVDLAVAYGANSVNSPLVIEASERVIAAAQKHNKPIGLFVSDAVKVPLWFQKGIHFFAIGSDHQMMLAGFHQQREQLEQ